MIGADRELLQLSEDRGRGRVHDLRDAGRAHRLENAQCPDAVDLAVLDRMLDRARVPDGGCEVEDHVDASMRVLKTSASRTSPITMSTPSRSSTFSRNPDEKLSSTRTATPSLRSIVTTFEPMNPPPPVTTAVLIVRWVTAPAPAPG